MRNVAVFIFLAAASIALFSFLVAVHWIDTRAAERHARERSALLRKIAEQPTESARLLVDLVREEDAREEQRALRRREKSRRDDMQGGMFLVAVGIGLSIMLAALVPTRVWTVGLIPGLLGVVLFTFAFFSPRSEA